MLKAPVLFIWVRAWSPTRVGSVTPQCSEAAVEWQIIASLSGLNWWMVCVSYSCDTRPSFIAFEHATYTFKRNLHVYAKPCLWYMIWISYWYSVQCAATECLYTTLSVFRSGQVVIVKLFSHWYCHELPPFYSCLPAISTPGVIFAVCQLWCRILKSCSVQTLLNAVHQAFPSSLAFLMIFNH